jgi:hypothetical protein
LAYPQLNANFGTTYFPNVAVQSFPNFIAAGTYGVLAAEGVKNGNGRPLFLLQILEIYRHSLELNGMQREGFFITAII